MTNSPRPTLADYLAATRPLRLRITDAAALQYADGRRPLDEARADLAELLLGARRSTSDPANWRARRRSTGVDISARIVEQRGELVVLSVNARDYDPPSSTRPAHRPPRAGVAASERIEVRVTPEVAEHWRKAAGRMGLTVTQLVLEGVDLAIARGSTR